MGRRRRSAPSIPQIRVPTATELFEQSLESTLRNLPRILEAYQKFGPEFTKTETDLFIQAQQRAPEAFPETYAVLRPLQRFITDRIEMARLPGLEVIPEPILIPFREAIRGAQAARGIAESPISAIGEATALSGLAEDFRQRAIREGISFLGAPQPGIGSLSYSVSEMGLAPPGLGDLISRGQAQAALQAQATLGQYALQQQRYAMDLARSQARRRAIGALGGAIIGSAFGMPWVGAGIGSAVGGTFF